jgi:RNA polymerase sigma factor (sigma-70 family)
MIDRDEPLQLQNQRDRCEQLVSGHYDRMYRWFLWSTNSAENAADLTHDTFVALWQSLDRFDDRRPFTPWLYGIARNVWRKHCAGRLARGIDPLESAPEEPDPGPSPMQAMLSREAGRRLEEAVAQLSPEYREAVVLRFWEDLDYGEISEALAISEGLARWRVHQARKMLLRKLSKAGLTTEQLFRSGAKFGWWLRLHKRPGPPLELLDRCLATIPQIEPPVRIRPREGAEFGSGPPVRLLPAEATRAHAQHPMKTNLESVRVGTLKELEAKTCMVVRLDQAVAVFHSDGRVFAVENRCPHMGFPLHRGSVEDGILTCYWHHARFDLASGCTFHLWADDVARYPVEIRGEEVWVLAREPRDDVAHWKHRLKEGIQHYLALVIGKATLALLDRGVHARDIVRQAALFGACYRDDWASGMTILTAMANLLPHLENEEKFLPLWHGVVQMAHNVQGASPHWDGQPLETDQVSLDSLKRWLRHWALVRHRDGVERCLLTAIANGASPGELADLLASAATDRIVSDAGRVVDFMNKAFELLALIGWEHASEVLPTIVGPLVNARGSEETSKWRHPVDLVSLLRQVDDELSALMHEGRRHGAPAPSVTAGLTKVLLGEDPAAIIKTLKGALQRGVPPVELSKEVAYAAAMRICRFTTANEFSDWLTVLDTFTYGNALHQTLKRASSNEGGPSAELVRGLFHGALRVYLDRFLNIPTAALPGQRGGLDDLPANASELLEQFLLTMNGQAQINEAGRIVARYIALQHPAGPLIRVLVRAVVREDANFRTYQMLEATVQQYQEWGDTEQGGHILIAGARYIAAHSPTQREMLQTAEIVERLHRGEDLHEQ